MPLPEVRGGGAEGDGGAVLSYKSKVSLKVNLSPGSSAEGGEGTNRTDEENFARHKWEPKAESKMRRLLLLRRTFPNP